MVQSVWILYFTVIACKATLNRGFKSGPSIVKTFENDTVWLQCNAEDVGVQTRVRWFKNGNTLLVDSEEPSLLPPKRVRMWSDKSIEVSHVQLTDAGKYMCNVSLPDPWGYFTQMHEIVVLYPPTVHSVPESGELEVDLGDEVDMACISKGVPMPIILWRTKDGDDIRPRLRFPATDRNLSGLYTCIANNSIGEVATASIELRIRYKPEVEIKKTWVHASPGTRAELYCRVTAWPKAKVEWIFQNGTIQYSSRIVYHIAEGNHSLIIRSVKTTDYGDYACRARNSLGSTDAIVTLSGVANPAVFKEAQPISRTAYNFIWEVDCYIPIIEYQFWFRKYARGSRGEWHKLFIPSGSDATGPVHARSFNLTGLASATHYEAMLFSRNRYGMSRPSRVLRFSTEGAPTDLDEGYKTNGLADDKIIPAVQLASMSQHSPLDTMVSNGTPQLRQLMLPAVTIILHILLSVEITTHSWNSKD